MGDLGVLVFDECHHARKKHPYARIMAFYLEQKKSNEPLPKVHASSGRGVAVVKLLGFGVRWLEVAWFWVDLVGLRWIFWVVCGEYLVGWLAGWLVG